MRNFFLRMIAIFSSITISWALLAQVSIVGAGYQTPARPIVAPGEVRTLFVPGLNTRLSTPQVATVVPLPKSLAGISVGLQQGNQSYTAPLFRIQQTNFCLDATSTAAECGVTAITIQVPFEIQPSGVPVGVTIFESGAASQTFSFTALSDQLHVLTYCDIVFGPPAGQDCDPIVTHADYTPVSIGSPAVLGETVIIWLSGLGVTNPRATTGQAGPNPAPTGPNVAVDFDFYPNATPSRIGFPGNSPPQGPGLPPNTWLTAGYVGLYQMNVSIPKTNPGTPCGLGVGPLSNLTINLQVNGTGSFDGAPICVVSPPNGAIRSSREKSEGVLPMLSVFGGASAGESFRVPPERPRSLASDPRAASR
jgi:uncharacterized protein (TIGR03437 family)